jgi:hypothetical protein
MRQKQAAKAKLLATQAIQREGIRKEKKNSGQQKMLKKQANADRMKTPPPGSTTS